VAEGFGIPSSAAFGQIGDAYVAEAHRSAKKNSTVRFARGENKEEIARPLDAAERDGGDGRCVADRDCAGNDPGVAVLEGS
jgi:hypothetical protein